VARQWTAPSLQEGFDDIIMAPDDSVHWSLIFNQLSG